LNRNQYFDHELHLNIGSRTQKPDGSFLNGVSSLREIIRALLILAPWHIPPRLKVSDLFAKGPLTESVQGISSWVGSALPDFFGATYQNGRKYTK
jgi:hypothetical protein